MEYYKSGLSSYMDYDVLKGIYDDIPESCYNRVVVTDVELYENIDEILNIPNLNALKISLSNALYKESIIAQLSSIETLVKLELTSIDCETNTKLPQAIFELKSLKILHINNIHITEVSESIGQLENLEELWIYHTGLQYLPNNMSKLIKLTHLGIEANDIRALPDTLSALSELRTLDVFCNSLSSLHSSLSKLPKLERLDALYNEALVEVPKELLLSDTLKKLMY